MHFTDTFIRRPVFATVLSLIILLVGLVSYFSLTVRLYPKMNAAVVQVEISYPGADAELVEGFVTTPVENALAGIDGIDYFTSSSRQGRSSVHIYFKMGYDINTAVSDVNAKITASRFELPADIKDPIISKDDPNAEPIMYLDFYGSSMSVEEITDYLSRAVQPQLQTLPGVASAPVWGSSYAMRIWLNPQLMAAHSVTAGEVKNALLTQSLQAPAGQIETTSQVFNVKTFSELATSEQFNHLVIKNEDGHLTRVSDIGRAELGTASECTVFTNGKPSVVIPITSTSTANPLEVAAAVKKLIPKIKQNLPAGLTFSLLGDFSKFIAESIKEVKKTIVEATLCVILVVFLFLGSWRGLLVPLVTIPLSLVGVCGIMLIMGYSLNTITFLAFVLAIGMVVDDAIVVAENIHRHMIAGKARKEAALLGAREIQFAIISMTLTLAAVYAPIGFLTGIVGSLFKEFAFTLASAVIISGFIALTLSPMMCSKIMLLHTKPGSFAARVDAWSDKLMLFYRILLANVLRRKIIVALLVPVILVASAILYKLIPSDLAPTEDSGVILVAAHAPTSATLAYTEEHTKLLESILSKIPEQENILIINGGHGGKNKGFAIAILKPWEERKRQPDQIIPTLMPEMFSITGIQAFPFTPNTLPINDSPISMVLQTTGSYQELHKIMHELESNIRANPGIVNAHSNLKIDQPQLDVYVDRNKAGDLGITMKDIGDAINLGLGKPTVGRFGILGRSYDVVPQLDENFRNHPEVLNNLYVNTALGGLVPLSQLITIKESLQPQNLAHFQQRRSATLSADLASGYTLGQALDYLQKITKKITAADKRVQVDYSGLSRQYFEAGNQMLVIFIFAIIFIFLVLAAQFESFRDPLIVLFSIPLSMFGALLVLYLTGNTLNIYSQIGLVTLVGLISKHGILMVEFANQLQVQGRGVREAIVEAASIRLRPILMTTAAIVIGAIPLVLASGASAISRQQIGWVIIGGMTIGTLFTLFVVPSMYIYLATRKVEKEKL